jgi:dihydrofolate synthase / folylpolyglutamate synthase
MLPTSDELIRRRSALSRGFVAERTGDPTIAERGLTRMGILLQTLGDPQRAYPTVHVAGSKGKGTTTHITSALLSSLGKKIGRYTSPHLVEWSERIAVDDSPITESDFARILTGIDTTMLTIERQLPELGGFNAFELLTGAAFVYFRDQGCDAAVIEVGLGGRFDPTNHLHPVVSVITRIEEEHVDVLGPTIREVAWNKAGTIKPNTPVVVTEQEAVVDAVLAAEAEWAGAHVLRENRDWHVFGDRLDLTVQTRSNTWQVRRATLPGKHNHSNIGAALVAAELAAGERGLTNTQVSQAFSALRIPGRFERRTAPHLGRQLILDVAHTPQSLAAVIEAAIATTGERRYPMVLGLLSDKPAVSILTTVAPFAEQVIFPIISSPRAHDPKALQAVAANLGVRASVGPSVQAALAEIDPGVAPILVMGSFSIVADCYRALFTGSLFET